MNHPVKSFLLRRMGGLILRGLRFPFFMGCLIISLCRLIRELPRLKNSRKIIGMEGGRFGHTIIVPEAARRLFKGENPSFIILSDRNFHNPVVAALWSDIKVIFLPFGWRIRFFNREIHAGGPSVSVRKKMVQWLIAFLKGVTHAEIFSLLEFYVLVAAVRPVQAVKDQFFNAHWIPGWAGLLEKVPAAPGHLPVIDQQRIRSRIQKFMRRYDASAGQPKFCCLYLRARGQSVNVESLRRVGSPFEAYLPAVEFLIKNGYVVLVTGDREVKREYALRFKGKIVSASLIGIDPWFFDLFAATESSVWIGDTGGGAWLSIINSIPMLAQNVFPYGFGVVNAWMCYKSALDKNGTPLSLHKLLVEHSYDYVMEGITVQENSADEIRKAVELFLIQMGHPRDNKEEQVIQSLPEHLLLKHVGSRFLTADVFGSEETIVPLYKEWQSPPISVSG